MKIAVAAIAGFALAVVPIDARAGQAEARRRMATGRPVVEGAINGVTVNS
jgi:hypothetical protein